MWWVGSTTPSHPLRVRNDGPKISAPRANKNGVGVEPPPVWGGWSTPHSHHLRVCGNSSTTLRAEVLIIAEMHMSATLCECGAAYPGRPGWKAGQSWEQETKKPWGGENYVGFKSPEDGCKLTNIPLVYLFV